MLKKIILGILVFFSAYLWPVAAHPSHVSLSTFHYNFETNSVEITMKLFTDDLEKALESTKGGSFNLGSKNENAAADSLIYNYIREKMVLAIDNSNISIQWVGKEVEYDIIWCYLEIININSINFVTIENRIFFEIFELSIEYCSFHKKWKCKIINAASGESKWRVNV